MVVNSRHCDLNDSEIDLRIRISSGFIIENPSTHLRTVHHSIKKVGIL